MQNAVMFWDAGALNIYKSTIFFKNIGSLRKQRHLAPKLRDLTIGTRKCLTNRKSVYLVLRDFEINRRYLIFSKYS